MNEKKKSPLVFLSGTCLVTICVSSVGYSAYLIVSTTTQEAGVGVIASEVIKGSGITVHITSNNSNVMFDSMYLDTSGRVTSDSESEKIPTIEVVGYLEGYTTENFIGINPVLQVAQDDREAYDYLVDNNYIVEPSFSQLGKTEYYDSSLSTVNSFYWTSAASDQRTFILNYQYTYGSFFNYMNPSEFFDSTYTNSLGKKGTDYSTSEIREILSHFEDVNDASYTLYLDVMTEGSLFDVTVDAGDGSFSSTDTTNKTYTISNLTYHSKVEPLTPYLDDNIFQYWQYGSSSTEYTGYFYINELATFSVGTSITVTAQYKAASSSLTVQYANNYNDSASITFNVQSEDGITTYTSKYGDGTSFSLLIGDIITVTSKSGVGTISAASGLARISTTMFRVTASTCILSVVPIPSHSISFELSTSTNLTYITFSAGDTTETYSTVSDNTSSFKSITVDEGSSLSFTNVRGVDHFTDSNGNTITSLTNITEDMTVKVVPVTNLVTLTINYTNSYSNKDTFTCNVKCGDITLGSIETNSSSASFSYCYVSGEKWSITDYSGCNNISTESGTISTDTTVNVTGSGDDGCILPGTLINMADGTYKRVEDVKVGDQVLVFDHMTGKIRTGVVALNDHDNEVEEKDLTVINLNFSNGKEIGVIYEHGFFDIDENRYVYINESNYRDYIGHRFYAIKGNGDVTSEIVTLDFVNVYEKQTRYYSPGTVNHLNVITEDILSMPGSITGLFNIFDLDENMLVIPELMKQDIEKYGLYSYEDWNGILSYEEFCAFNVKYLKVSIGKGLTTRKLLEEMVDRILRH